MSSVDTLDRSAPASHSPPDPDGASVDYTKRGWRDLVAAAIVALLGIVVSAGPPLIAIPIGVLATLLVPGYLLVSAVFPSERDLEGVDRIALALGMSIGLIAVQALVLDRLLGGMTAGSVRALVGGCSLLLLLIAVVRRARAAEDRSILPSAERELRPRTAPRVERFTRIIAAAGLLVAGATYALTVLDSAAPPTEFYVLGREGQLAQYPLQTRVGEAVTLRVGVRQATGTPGRYSIGVYRGADLLAHIGPLALEAGARWEDDVRFVLDRAGADQELLLRLEDGVSPEPVRTLRLWIDVPESAVRR